MKKSTTTKRIALELAAATLLLMIPALVNGYPLVFSDTGTYVRQAIEFYGAADRPPYYSLLIFLFHLKLSLWPVVVMQAFAMAAALRVVIYSLIARARTLHYLGMISAMTAFTSIGWHVDQIMPDAFTGMLTIVVFLIVWMWDQQRRTTRIALLLIACGIVMLHYTHLALAAGLFAVAALARLAQSRAWYEVRRIAVLGGAVVTVAAAAFVAYSLVLIRRPVLDPNSSIFMAARVLAEGPGREWLAKNCPGSGNIFCKYQDRLPSNPDTFLWADTSPLQDALRDPGPEQTRRATAQIVAGAFALHPGTELADMLTDSARQFVRFGTLDINCPLRCGEDSAVTKVIERHFHREYSQFRNSLEMRGRLPVRQIRDVHLPVVIAAWIIFLVAGVVAVRRGDSPLVGFELLVLATLLLNAMICGGLWVPHDRYGSRVVWLLPLGAMLAAGRLWYSSKKDDAELAISSARTGAAAAIGRTPAASG